jgi:glucokinase
MKDAPDNTAPVLGIDLGGTHCQVGVVDAHGKVIGRSRGYSEASQGYHHVLQRIADLAREACASAGIDRPAAVGIGAPGVIDAATGTVVEAPNLQWTNASLRDDLADYLDHPNVTVENDVNAAILGEWAYGAAQGADHALGIWIGTGVGGGLILNGELWRGPTGSGGEIGQTVLLPDAALGRRKLEQTCSRSAIEHRLAKLLSTNYPSSLDKAYEEGKPLNAHAIAQAYEAGDQLVRRVVDESVALLGTAIANALTLLGIELVVAGGGLTELMGDTLCKRLEERARSEAFPPYNDRIRVVKTRLEDDAGLLGAAWAGRRAISR